jgi:hypothetical protein
MSELQTIRRVTVYADSTLEEKLVEHFLKLGSTGYTIVDCRGKGEHDSAVDPFTTTSHVRIELLVQPAVADKVMAFVQSNPFRGHALTSCVETVQAPVRQHF